MRILFLYLSLFSIASIVAIAQTRQTVDSLLGDLANPQKTTQAADVLLKVAEAQPSVADELSSVLPNLLLSSTDIEVVQSEAALAGRLRLVSAIPALILLLDRPNRKDETHTFSRYAELHDDPVGRALADIGAPAVPPLMVPLESVNVAARERAARVLIRINTPESFSLLQQHVGHETDGGLKRYIAANLARTAH
jgi:HEAT repeat protein